MEHQEQVKEQEHQLIQQKSTPNTNSGLSKESVPLQFKSNSFAPPLQRKENTNFNIAQLFANKNGSENTSIQMKSTKGSLPEAVQTKMESSMGADFSGVNIQTNSKSAQDVGALAYTQGSDVHFAPGQFKPDTKGGQELIGHELAHVIQQKAGRVKANKSVGNMPVNDNTSLEKEADVAGAKAAAGKPFSVAGSGGGIQMKAAPIQMKKGILQSFNHEQAEAAITGEDTNFWRLGTSWLGNEDLKKIDGNSTIYLGSQISVIKSNPVYYDDNLLFPAYDSFTNRYGYVKDRKIMIVEDATQNLTQESYEVYDEIRDSVMDYYINTPVALSIAPKLGGQGAGKEAQKLRDSLKGAARQEFYQGIDDAVGEEGVLTGAKKEYIASKAKEQAYGEAKKYVEQAVRAKAYGIVQKYSQGLRESLLHVAMAAYHSASKSGNRPYETAFKEAVTFAKRHKDMIQSQAMGDVAQQVSNYNISSNPDGNVLFGEVSGAAKDKIQQSGEAKTIVKKQMDADSISKGLQMIGSLIDTAVPRAGTDAAIDVELKIPVGDIGLASASILFHFGGEASKDYDDNNNLEINAKAEMGIGASFEVAKILEFKGQIDFYIESQANSINNLMKLFSYGGFRTANAMSPTMAGYLWGNGGKSGLSRKQEAALWANAIEEESITGTENYVELGGKLSAGMDFNTGIGKGSGGLSAGLGRRFDADSVGVADPTTMQRNDGKTVFFVNGEYEMELGGGYWGAGVSGSYKSVSEPGASGKVEREVEFVLSTKITSGYGNAASEIVPLDKVNHLLSSASPWVREFEKEAVDKENGQYEEMSGGRALNNYGQSIGDLAMMSGAVHDKIGGFATSKMGEAGESDLTGDMEDVFEANTSTVLEISFKRETNKTWAIEVTLKSEKEKVLRLGIMEASVTSGRKLASGSIGGKDIPQTTP